MSNLLESAFSDAEGIVSFQQRPEPIPADLRLSWRLSSLALVLERCRGKTASIEQLHLLMWGLRSEEGGETLVRLFEGETKPDDFIVRYDPALSRTIALAVAAGIAAWKTDRTISITSAGRSLAETINAAPHVMVAEKEYLSRLPPSISQKAIRELLEVW